MPMTLRLSHLSLRAILILVVSASKGITLVFKNDPLQNVEVSSTFDSVEVIRGYLQQEIEGQLREMFREDLPGIIHRLSQRWFTGTGTSGKVETPYRDEGNTTITSRADEEEDVIDPSDPFVQSKIFPTTQAVSTPTNSNLTPRRKAAQRASRRLSTAASESPTSYTTFPDLEEYDPTYGLRPEGLPTHSGYEAFGRLWEKAREGEGRGLGGLNHSGEIEEEEEEDDEVGSLDAVDLDDSLRPMSSRRTSGRSRQTADEVEDVVEWETFPAVGGGTITRPRVYHALSQIRAPSEAGEVMATPSPGGTATGGSMTARASSIGAASSTAGVSAYRLKTYGLIPQSTRGASTIRTLPAFARPDLGGPGPSSLRHQMSSRSDAFATRHQPTRSESYQHPQLRLRPSHTSHASFSGTALSTGRAARSATNASSSAARTSGSSWETGGTGPSRSGTFSTLATSHMSSPEPASLTRRKASGTSLTGIPPSLSMRNIGPGGITLPHSSVSALASLSYSAQTLSPYARGHEHIAVRSFPNLGKTPIPTPSAHAADAPVKARQKRIYHLNKKKDEPALAEPPQTAPLPDRKNKTRSAGSLSRGNSEYDVRSLAFSHLSLDEKSRQGPQTPSMSGLAEKVMSPGLRPNMARSPDSRTSYGFPPHFEGIPE